MPYHTDSKSTLAIKQIAVVLLATLASTAHAAKDGWYAGIGISTNAYRSNDSSSFVRVVEDEQTTGWRAEFGHIWDLGKAGGFQIGVAGAYDDLGKVSASEQNGDRNTDVSIEASALTAYFVIDQEIASWVDFVFKVGPSVIDYEAESCCTLTNTAQIDDRKTRVGGAAAIAFVFFPTQNIGIELSAQAFSWYTGNLSEVEDEDDFYNYLDSRVAARSLSASLQYRF